MKMCLDSTVKLAEDEKNCMSWAITNIWIIQCTSVRHSFPNDPANPSASLLISTKPRQAKSLLGKENHFAVRKTFLYRGNARGFQAPSNGREVPLLRPLKGEETVRDLSESGASKVTLRGWALDTSKEGSPGVHLASVAGMRHNVVSDSFSGLLQTSLGSASCKNFYLCLYMYKLKK